MRDRKTNQNLATRRHTVDILFTLALFCVFAASSLMVVLIGANVYKNSVAVSQDNFQLRTSISYLATKIRHSEVSGSIRIDSIAGTDALVLTETLDQNVFETWIYCHDGNLRETLVSKGTSFSPETGQIILPLSSFAMEQKTPALIRLEFEFLNNETHPLYISPRCE